MNQHAMPLMIPVEQLRAGEVVRVGAVLFVVAHPARFWTEGPIDKGYIVLEHTPDSRTGEPCFAAEIQTVFRGEMWEVGP